MASEKPIGVGVKIIYTDPPAGYHTPDPQRDACVCKRCGAWVELPGTHEAWHAEVDGHSLNIRDVETAWLTRQARR